MTHPPIPQWQRWIATPVVTVLGAGFSPKAPGTAGSLMGVALAFLMRDASPVLYAALWISLFLLGWWSTLIWSKLHQTKDSQAIVIDEVLGYLIAVATLPASPVILGIQFLFFRLFDVVKPPPIRQLDHWGKRFPIGPTQSLGVILDDLLAGFFSLILFLGVKTLVISMGIVDSSLFSAS